MSNPLTPSSSSSNQTSLPQTTAANSSSSSTPSSFSSVPTTQAVSREAFNQSAADPASLEPRQIRVAGNAAPANAERSQEEILNMLMQELPSTREAQIQLRDQFHRLLQTNSTLQLRRAAVSGLASLILATQRQQPITAMQTFEIISKLINTSLLDKMLLQCTSEDWLIPYFCMISCGAKPSLQATHRLFNYLEGMHQKPATAYSQPSLSPETIGVVNSLFHKRRLTLSCHLFKMIDPNAHPVSKEAFQKLWENLGREYLGIAPSFQEIRKALKEFAILLNKSPNAELLDKDGPVQLVLDYARSNPEYLLLFKEGTPGERVVQLMKEKTQQPHEIEYTNSMNMLVGLMRSMQTAPQ